MIREKLEVTWSPEQIANRLFKGAVCFKTIYRWLYQGRITVQVPRPQRKTSEAIGNKWSVQRRNTDCQAPRRGKKRKTFVERKTRWYVTVK
jgi:transposase, IS30 family